MKLRADIQKSELNLNNNKKEELLIDREDKLTVRYRIWWEKDENSKIKE